MNDPLLFRQTVIDSERCPDPLLTRTGGNGMTPMQTAHIRHGHTMLFSPGDRVTVPARGGRRPGEVTDESSRVVWVRRHDQPTASPYLKDEVEVVK